MSNFQLEYSNLLHKYEDAPGIQTLMGLKNQRKPVVVYGLGEQAMHLLEFCSKRGIQVEAVADSHKSGDFFHEEYKILTLQELKERYEDPVILIGSWKFNKSIKEGLLASGYQEEQVIEFPFSHPYVIEREDFEERYLEGYRRAYDFFQDELSRKIIIDRIGAYLYDGKMLQTSIAPKYFEVPMEDHEIFVQAGTYCGETVMEFMELYQAHEGYQVYTFEADPQAYAIATGHLSGKKNVNLINKGLWSKDTELTFFTDALSGSASFVNGTSQELRIPVTSLDDFFKKEGCVPTFIQLDIEGAELEALKGARELIQKHKPKLAICVYHKYEDVYEIPELLVALNQDYHFWLQHCEDGIYDTILYAI